MNDTINTEVDVNRLVSLATWLTVEERKRRLGQPSEWNQGVWVQARDHANGSSPNIQVEGDQVFWSCGTAACLAGHIALEDGGRPAFYDRRGGGLLPLPVDDDLQTLSDSFMFFGRSDRAQGIDDHARQALGLDDDQAGQLFEGENDYETVIELISEFTGIGEGELLARVGGLDLPPDPDAYDDGHCDCGCEDDEPDSDW